MGNTQGGEDPLSREDWRNTHVAERGKHAGKMTLE